MSAWNALYKQLDLNQHAKISRAIYKLYTKMCKVIIPIYKFQFEWRSMRLITVTRPQINIYSEGGALEVYKSKLHFIFPEMVHAQQ